MLYPSSDVYKNVITFNNDYYFLLFRWNAFDKNSHVNQDVGAKQHAGVPTIDTSIPLVASMAYHRQ